MAEIIQFGDKHKSSSAGTASAAALAFKTNKSDDWGNQELADLYRVKRLLEQAGVHVETDRGLTDEGDPWFVFCHPDGDVFVHLCRIDGHYLLDSTSIEAPLRGNSFADLINQFVDRAIERRAANVVSLRPGDGVYLHPAIMLTALIWTLFVASDELVGIAHGAEIDAAGPDFEALTNSQVIDFADTQGAFGVLKSALSEIDDDQPVVPKAAEMERAQNEPIERDVNSHLNVSSGVNLISLSLSAIAVTFGMTSKSTFEFMLNAQSSDLGLNEAKLPLFFDPASVVESEETIPQFEQDPENFGQGEFSSDKPKDVDIDIAAKKLAAVLNIPKIDLNAASDNAVSTQALDVAAIVADADIDYRALIATRGREQQEKASNVKEEAAEDESQSFTGFSMIENFGQELSLAEYQLDNHKLLTSFDVSTEQGQDWLKSLVENGSLVFETQTGPSQDDGPLVGGTIRASTVTEYSEKAMSFVKYMLSKSDTVEMVVLKGKIILVDLSAFDDVEDVSYLRNWAHEDVGIISTIGHLSDFEAFGLVVA